MGRQCTQVVPKPAGRIAVLARSTGTTDGAACPIPLYDDAVLPYHEFLDAHPTDGPAPSPSRSKSSSSRRSSSNADENSTDDPDSIAFKSAVNHAVAAASLRRDYRTRHGVKVALALIFQVSALPSSILLRYFALNPDRGSAPNTTSTSLPPITSMFTNTMGVDGRSGLHLPPIASLFRDTHAESFEES
ncbi:hypothetical protein EJ03DRAFT_114644 [Teratosphaeria nubilosa]|uniref:Uncharacterized protein n=1 Tax=Teratosphaeria nubilosa TaxID=161662 RepID=A0A6G1L7D7_9PEZI|nr:hypothetical protein EJ03DRAFT_114644 [Teratosphaeria nubilosa]